MISHEFHAAIAADLARKFALLEPAAYNALALETVEVNRMTQGVDARGRTA